MLTTILLGVVLPAATYLAVRGSLSSPRPPLSFIEAMGIDPDTFDLQTFTDTLSPQTAQRLGLLSTHPATELIVVVVSSSGCWASRSPHFRDAVQEVPAELRARFRDRPDVVVRMVGVALDWDVRAGVEHLSSLGEFDEITSGGNRLNTATEKYLRGKYALGGGTPQIVLLERTVTWTASGVHLENEKLIKTLLGAEQVVDWVRQGVPVEGIGDAPCRENECQQIDAVG